MATAKTTERTPAEVIKSLEVGKFADIIGVKGDPLSDIKVMQHVMFVMKGGVIHPRQTPPAD